MLRHGVGVGIGLDDGYNVSDHVLLGISSVHRLDLREVGTMPYFGNVIIVHSDAIFINFERTHDFGQPVKSIKRLIIQMEDIRKRYVHDVRQSDRNLLSIEIACVNSKKYPSRTWSTFSRIFRC